MINSVIHHLGIGLRYPKDAEPFFDTLLIVPKFGRVQRRSGRLIMDAELGALFGIIFWLVVVVGSFAYYNNT